MFGFSGRRIASGIIWPLFEMITDSGAAPNKVIDEWVQPMIKRAIETKRLRGLEKMGAEEGSLVDHLTDMMDDERAIRDEVIFFRLQSKT